MGLRLADAEVRARSQQLADRFGPRVEGAAVGTLRVAYRSSEPIVTFAMHVLGELAEDDTPPLTVREGVAGWETTLARGAEIDAYQVAVARRETGTPEPDRSAVYCDWLAERLPPTAAHLRPESLRVDAYRSTRLLRRPRTPDGKRGAQWLTRPDVHFSGTLEVADGEAFARLLASGVGRHCGFGFGMLLLKPA